MRNVFGVCVLAKHHYNKSADLVLNETICSRFDSAQRPREDSDEGTSVEDLHFLDNVVAGRAPRTRVQVRVC